MHAVFASARRPLRRARRKGCQKPPEYQGRDQNGDFRGEPYGPQMRDLVELMIRRPRVRRAFPVRMKSEHFSLPTKLRFGEDFVNAAARKTSIPIAPFRHKEGIG